MKAATPTHTPGPWTLTLTDKGNACIGAEVTRWPDMDSGKHIARAHYVREIKTEGVVITIVKGSTVPLAEGLANANLIAAAPELLDALRAFCGDHEATGMECAGLNAAYLHAKQIIAKAEGQS